MAEETLLEYRIQELAEEQLPQGAELLRLTVTADEVDVLLDTAGQVDLADIEAAAAALHAENPDVTIRVRVQDSALIEFPAE